MKRRYNAFTTQKRTYMEATTKHNTETISLRKNNEWCMKQAIDGAVHDEVWRIYLANERKICTALGIEEKIGILPWGEKYTYWNQEQFYANWDTEVEI